MAFPSASTKAEYQHFIPQFLLRNFSERYKPPKNTSGRKSKQGHIEGQWIHSNEPVVSHVDLTVDELAVKVVPVKRVMGMNNMYEDLAQATVKQRRHIEDMFGKLERRASLIFRQIVKGVERGDIGLWLPREDRNVLRKFLFLLTYRGSQSHRRFYLATPDEYNSEDGMELYQYMLDRGFDRPVDVWFDNLKAIAECEMDAEGQWMEDIQKRMYAPDARWFCHHTQQSYLAFCSPSSVDAEFLLAENSYSVYEGIHSFLLNPKTGQQTNGPWVNFHYFAPISPKVVIVLRSNLLPLPEEDFDDEVREERDQRRSAAVDHWFGTGRQSGLADLPITKARSNYTELIDGQLKKLQPYAPRSRDDRFFFKFFQVNNDHVNKINSFMLDGARSSIVFASPNIFTRTLEWYLTDRSQTWKNVVGTEDERQSKVTLLTKLSALMESLGSTAEPIWEEFSTVKSMSATITGQRLFDVPYYISQRVMDDIIMNADHGAAKPEPSLHPFLELYTKLGKFEYCLFLQGVH